MTKVWPKNDPKMAPFDWKKYDHKIWQEKYDFKISLKIWLQIFAKKYDSNISPTKYDFKFSAKDMISKIGLKIWF